MKYSTLRWKLNIIKKGINFLILVCILFIIGLAKPNEVGSQVKLIAKPLFKPFFDQFESKSRDFTNIFNIKE